MYYDKYNILSRVTNSSNFLWTTTRTINNDSIIENTYFDIGNYYIENTYDKYGNLVLTKEGQTSDALDVVKEVYYSDLDVESITMDNPQEETLKKNKYSKLRKTIDKLLMNTTKYYYDNKDRIKNIVNSSTTYKPGLTEYEYDEYNRLTTIKVNLNSGVIFTENIEYESGNDAYKNILSSRINYSDGSENREFEVCLNEEKDSLGRIDYHSFEINDSTEIKRHFVYKDVGSSVSGLVERLDLDINTTAVDKLYYEYDISGNITREHSLSNAIDNKYTYDTLGRLIREDNKGLDKSTVITYDLGGNILSKQVSSYTLGSLPTTATKYTYEYQQYHADYLNKYNGQTVQTASCGNIEKIGNTTYSWDRYRFLKQAKLSSYDYVDMLYDVDGIRYKKTHYDNGTTITHNYVCEGTKILSENIIGGSYAGTLNYLYIGNQIIGFTYKNKQYYYQKNLQGDIIRIYDTSNNLVAYYQYDAWGNHRVYNPTGTINTSDSFIGNINPFRYRGYYYDRESNLYYCNARYYNPELCRWMSLDSIEYAEADRLNGCNLYAYCNNNPIMYVDPNGHFVITTFLVCLAVGIVAGAGLGALSAVQQGTDIWRGVLTGALLGGVIGAATGLALAGAPSGIVARIGKSFIKAGMDSVFGKFSADFTAYIFSGKEIGSLESYMSAFVFGGTVGALGLKGGWKAFADVIARPAYSILVDDMLFQGKGWSWEKYGTNVAIRGLTFGLSKDLKAISRGFLNGLYYEYQLDK